MNVFQVPPASTPQQSNAPVRNAITNQHLPEYSDSNTNTSNLTLPNKMSNILSKGESSSIDKNAIQSLVSSSTTGFRTHSKSSSNDMEGTTNAAAQPTKSSHGFSNSMRKLKGFDNEENGGLMGTDKFSMSPGLVDQNERLRSDQSALPTINANQNQGPQGFPMETVNSITSSQYTQPNMLGPDEALNHKMSDNEEVMVSNLQAKLQSGLVVLPPERPPKPAHLLIGKETNSHLENKIQPKPTYGHNSENYANAADMQELYMAEHNNNLNAEMQHHGVIQNFDVPVFEGYRPHQQANTNDTVVSSSTRNLSFSQNDFQAPMISRDLKPNRKNITSRNRSKTIGGNINYGSTDVPMSDEQHENRATQSNANMSHTIAYNFRTMGPPVARGLKPKSSDVIEGRSRFHSVDLTYQTDDQTTEENLTSSRRNSTEDEQIYYYMPPINTTAGLGGVHSSKPPPLMIPAASFEHPSIAYIDLDLPKTTSPTSKSSESKPPHDTGKVATHNQSNSRVDCR